MIGFSSNQDPNSLFATPSVTLNYTVVISQLVTTARHVVLSAVSTVPGVTLTVSPKEFALLGTQAVTFRISVAPTVNSSILPVEITANTASGETNATFRFSLDKALIVVLDNGDSRPPTLHASVGQTVTWLNLVDPTDENAGCVTLVDGSAASPEMDLNGVWSHTFDKPGTYLVQVIASGCPLVPGVVIIA